MNQTRNASPENSNGKSLDFFEKLGNKGYLFALFLIMLVAFFIFKDFILYKKAFLYKDIGSDTLNGIWPTYNHYAEYLRKNGIPRWSFGYGMGQNTFGGFLRDPFELIAFLSGPSSMPRIMIFVELLKVITSGLLFYLFLKTLKTSNFSATLGALLFSFCGFMVIGSCWYFFTYEAFNMVLLLLSFELLFQKNKWFLFIMAIFAVALSTPSNLFSLGLFLASYAAFRGFQQPGYNIKKLGLLYGKMILLGAIGLLLCAPLMLETLMFMLESPRGSGENSYFQKLISQPMFHITEKEQFGAFMMRFFSSDMLGSGSNFSINGIVTNGQFEQKNWGNFLEAPASYCGILSMVLMSQVFSLLDKPVRRCYIALFVLWLIPVIFPFFRYAFWLFNGDYYRVFSLMISLIFIIFSVKALDLILKHRKINLITLGVTVLILFILASYPYFKDYKKLIGGRPVIDEGIAVFVKVFIILYAVLLFMISKLKNTNALKYTLFALVAIELIYLSGFTVNRRDAVRVSELSEKAGVAYNDYSTDAVAYIKQTEKAPFYRIDKNYFSSGASNFSLNDNQMHGYYTTSSYNSFAQLNFINYLKAYNVISRENEYEARWAPGLINPSNRQLPVSILESLNNVKYILAKRSGPFNPTWNFTHDSINKFNDVLVLKSKFSLPFGYTYDKYITQSEFNKLSITQKELVSTAACVLKDEDVNKWSKGLTHYSLNDTISPAQFTLPFYKDNLDRLKKDSLTVSLFSENKIEGKAHASTDKILYLSFPYDKGWTLKVDGSETEKVFVNNGMTGVYLTKGNHSIELTFNLRFFNKGLILTAIGLILMAGFWYLNRKKTPGSNEPVNV
jgi:hypothetical protein